MIGILDKLANKINYYNEFIETLIVIFSQHNFYLILHNDYRRNIGFKIVEYSLTDTLWKKQYTLKEQILKINKHIEKIDIEFIKRDNIIIIIINKYQFLYSIYQGSIAQR